MAFNLDILQKPLDVTETHSDHTWNVRVNDYSAYTDIKLMVDVYKNPYSSDLGPIQISGKQARLIVPVNEYGNCIFNVESIIRDFVQANPRNLSMVITGVTSGTVVNNSFLVEYYSANSLSYSAQSNQATIVNERPSNVGFSNGFNGAEDGYEPLYQVNEYRLIFGLQWTSGGTTVQVIDTTNYNVYSGWTGQSINPAVAATQPYGVMIYPGVQPNKQVGVALNPAFNPYYTTDPDYNYHNTRAYSYAMNTGTYPFNQQGLFMATFGDETIPMKAFGGAVQNTRYRTHYYKCPIVCGFMYGENPLFDNSSIVKSISFLQKSSVNTTLNYDVLLASPIDFTSRPGNTNSYLNQRIAYAIWKQNPNVRTQSDVAIFLSSGGCDPTIASGVSEIVQYKMVGEECFNDPVSFLFMNRQGVWDTYTFTKKYSKTFIPEKKTFRQQKTLNTTTWNRQSYDRAESVFYGKADEIVTVDSNFVIQNDVQIIEELLMSPYVYQIMDNYTPVTPQTQIFPYLIPCTVQNKEVKQYINKYERIFQYTIELKQVPYRDYFIPF